MNMDMEKYGNDERVLAFKALSDPKGALSHLGLRVGTAGEVDAWKERLTERGVAGFDEKDTTCCYARQDKFWVSDPDGNRWEVYTVLEDTEDVARETLTACCAK